MRYRSRALALVLLLLLGATLPGSAQSFEGVYTGASDDGPTRFELRQTGSDVTGTMAIGTYRMSLTARVENGRAYGIAEVSGAPVRFGVLLARSGDTLSCGMAILKSDDQLDPETKTSLTLTRVADRDARPPGDSKASPGGGPSAHRPTRGPSAQGSARSTTIDATTLAALAGRVRSNFAPQRSTTVLAAGDPPLTLAALEAFGELMRLTFGVQLTEAEKAITRQQFVTYYAAGDARAKQMLAQGWQSILAQIEAASGAERERLIGEVRDVFADRFAKGAQAGMAWYVAMQATIDRRHHELAEVRTTLPAYAEKAHLDRDLSEADLDASLEMLYFMWVASGRDASLVTMESIAHVRASLVQSFSLFPPDVQLIFANAQQVYTALRAQWAQATPDQRLQMAEGFSSALDSLGLVVPSAAGGDDGGSAWSDVSTQSHGEWAASMVQGLAGSSYKSSW